jgi:hypothetical protein
VYRLLLLISLASASQACDLDRALRRYWADLKPGDLVESEAVTEGRTHRSTMRVTAEVVKAGSGLTLKVRERLEGEGKPGAGEAKPPKVVTETEATYALVETGGKAVVHESRVSVTDGKASDPRAEDLPLSNAANRLPGVASYCVEGPPLATESVETPAGNFGAKRYQAGETQLWVAADVPLGGLVRMKAASGEETVDQKVVRVVKGR